MQAEKPPIKSLAEVVADARKSLGEPVAYRYRIEEYRPAHSTFGYDGQDFEAELVEATIWFDDMGLALALLEVTTPSPGNVLKLRTQTAHDKVQRVWI